MVKIKLSINTRFVFLFFVITALNIIFWGWAAAQVSHPQLHQIDLDFVDTYVVRCFHYFIFNLFLLKYNIQHIGACQDYLKKYNRNLHAVVIMRSKALELYSGYINRQMNFDNLRTQQEARRKIMQHIPIKNRYNLSLAKPLQYYCSCITL